MNVALTIAGSDSGGGAGIQADLKAMQACGVFAASVVTAITAQNTLGVTAIHEVPEAIVRAQIDAVLDDLPVAAVKTGRLSSEALVRCVAGALAERAGGVPLVVDPVMIAKGGAPLLRPDAVAAVREALLPLAALVTPNTHEAAHLTGRPVETLAQAGDAARALVDMGCAAALVTGGHLAGERAVDMLFDGQTLRELSAPRVDTRHTHGTGCTTASAVAAGLARGLPLDRAVERAKRYVTGAIRAALPLGGGHGPTHHFWFLDGSGLFPADDLSITNRT